MKIEELTDEFVKTNYDLSSVDEFYRYLKETKELQLNQDAKMEAENQLFERAVQLCNYDLNEEEVLAVAIEIYDDYSNIAVASGVSVESYMQELLLISNLDDVYEECYNEAEEKIKYELLIGAIAYRENINVEEDKCFFETEDINSESMEVMKSKINYLGMKVKEYLLNEATKGE